MKYQPYPAYKDSGVEWLGQVPEHWEVKRIKWSVSDIRNGIWGNDPQNDENDITCIRVADFDRERLRVSLDNPTMRNVLSKERLPRLLSKGDLLIEKSGGGENQPVGVVVLYDSDKAAVCSNFVAKMTLRDGMNPSYWRYMHAASYSARLNIPSIKQTSGIQNLDQNSYLDELVPYPPAREQVEIAAGINRVVNCIDALITKKTRFIELLQEKRQALITRAVTRGLNPDAPLKDSGVEWIGEVPEHWEMLRIRHISSSVGGGTPEKSNLSYWGGDIPWVTPKDMKSERIHRSADKITEGGYQASSTTLIEPGAVLIVFRSGILQHTIPVAVNTCKVVVNQDMRAFKFKEFKKMLPDFFLRYIQGLNDTLLMLWRKEGATVESIETEHMNSSRMPVPPLAEQQEIIDYLATASLRLDTLITKTQRSIELLQERRSALITAAVTGQIDLREAA